MGMLNTFATSTLHSWLQHHLRVLVFPRQRGRGGTRGWQEKEALQEEKHALKKLQPLRLSLLLTLQERALEANPPLSAGALCDILSLRQAMFLMGLWERPGLPFHLYLLPAPLSSTASPYDIPLNYLDW